jgi:hypothetical protein
MKTNRLIFRVGLLLVCGAFLRAAEAPKTKTPAEIFSAAILKLANIIEPPPGAAAQTFSAKLKLAKAEGLPKDLAGRTLDLSFQSPDRLLLRATIDGQKFSVGRIGQELWVHVPEKQFGVVGVPDLPRFLAEPDKKDPTKLGPIKLPLPKDQLALLPILLKVEAKPSERIGGVPCHVLLGTPLPEAIEAFKIPKAQLQIGVRESDQLPMRISYFDGQGTDVQIDFEDPKLEAPWPEEKWKLTPRAEDKVERVALGHLSRFIDAALKNLNQKIPTLGPPTGERKVLAREGKGRLEMIDDTKVLFLRGTPEEMGHQHGVLLRPQVRDMVEHIVYGVGVGSSFLKGRWFFEEIEQAQKRLVPFMDPRYLQEMDAIASAAGLESQEIRLANYFPELFHCSGFSLFGKATVDGRMYHGRVLDYLKGVGLEQNAVVMVMQPDQGHAWVNISYAGFIGSVTAMNEKQISIGEMGGRGEGNWDGKPMAQLVREVMEKAGTIEEAIAILRKGPRTCEYYYVISDAKSKRAVGIAATPTKFETIWPGEVHPQLPHAIPDAVLMSAGDRYQTLAARVKEQHGKIDADSARDLMTRPVCMNSNIHSVLFAPDTLDFWVANADSRNVASHARYTRYNLAELLKPELVASQ